MRTETGPWWRQAQADLETAEAVLQARRFYAVSWFAQQAVEKGLKALYLESRGVLAPRTHDLEFLATEVSVPEDLRPDISLLNPTFDMSRYPNSSEGIAPVDLVSEARAIQHLDAVRRVFRWLAQQLADTFPRS